MSKESNERVVTSGDLHTKMEKGLNEINYLSRTFEKDRNCSTLLPVDVEVGDFRYTPYKKKYAPELTSCTQSAKVIFVTTHLPTTNHVL